MCVCVQTMLCVLLCVFLLAGLAHTGPTRSHRPQWGEDPEVNMNIVSKHLNMLMSLHQSELLHLFIIEILKQLVLIICLNCNGHVT